jgi:hypothetical protein
MKGRRTLVRVSSVPIKMSRFLCETAAIRASGNSSITASRRSLLVSCPAPRTGWPLRTLGASQCSMCRQQRPRHRRTLVQHPIIRVLVFVRQQVHLQEVWHRERRPQWTSHEQACPLGSPRWALQGAQHAALHSDLRTCSWQPAAPKASPSLTPYSSAKVAASSLLDAFSCTAGTMPCRPLTAPSSSARRSEQEAPSPGREHKQARSGTGG